MAGSFLQSFGTAQNKTSATTVAFTTTADIPAFTLLVIGISCDNAASTTAPTISSITALGGGTWTNRAGTVSQSGATTTAGSGIFVYSQTLYTTSLVPAGTTVTVTFSAATVAKAVDLWGFAGMSSGLRNTVVSGASTTGNPSATTSGTALVAGDLVIGILGGETSTAPTGDGDTTTGTWSTIDSVLTTGGSAATNVLVAMQYKFVTATGAQTFNPATSNDSVAIIYAMVPAIAVDLSDNAKPTDSTSTQSTTVLDLSDAALPVTTSDTAETHVSPGVDVTDSVIGNYGGGSDQAEGGTFTANTYFATAKGPDDGWAVQNAPDVITALGDTLFSTLINDGGAGYDLRLGLWFETMPLDISACTVTIGMDTQDRGAGAGGSLSVLVQNMTNSNVAASYSIPASDTTNTGYTLNAAELASWTGNDPSIWDGGLFLHWVEPAQYNHIEIHQVRIDVVPDPYVQRDDTGLTDSVAVTLIPGAPDASDAVGLSDAAANTLALDRQDTSGLTDAASNTAASTQPDAAGLADSVIAQRTLGLDISDVALFGGVASDNFNALPNASSVTSLGANWTQYTNAGFEIGVAAGQIYNSNAANTVFARSTTIPTGPSMYAQVTWAVVEAGVSVQAGPAVLVPPLGAGNASTGSCYVMSVTGTTQTSLSIRMKSASAGTLTVLGTSVTVPSIVAGDVLRLEYQDATAELVGYINGVEQIRRATSLSPLAETGVTRGVGFHMNNAFTNGRLDNFSGGDLNSVPGTSLGVGHDTQDLTGLSDTVTFDVATSQVDSAGPADLAIIDDQANAAADQLGLTDTVSKTIALGPSDTAGGTDTAATAGTPSGTYQDPLGLTDAVTFQVAVDRSDRAGAADTVSTVGSGGTTVSDAAGPTDTVSTVATLIRAASDPAGTTDPAASAVGLNRQDAASLVDGRTLVIGTNLADPVGPADSAATANVEAVNTADDAALFDSLSVALQTELLDNLSTPDVASGGLGGGAGAADTLGLADTIELQLARTYAASDGAGLADTLDFALALGLDVSDEQVLADLVVTLLTIGEVGASIRHPSVRIEGGPRTVTVGASGAVALEVRSRAVAVDSPVRSVDVTGTAGIVLE